MKIIVISAYLLVIAFSGFVLFPVLMEGFKHFDQGHPYATLTPLRWKTSISTGMGVIFSITLYIAAIICHVRKQYIADSILWFDIGYFASIGVLIFFSMFSHSDGWGYVIFSLACATMSITHELQEIIWSKNTLGK
jgi:hypothetical protein